MRARTWTAGMMAAMLLLAGTVPVAAHDEECVLALWDTPIETAVLPDGWELEKVNVSVFGVTPGVVNADDAGIFVNLDCSADPIQYIETQQRRDDLNGNRAIGVVPIGDMTAATRTASDYVEIFWAHGDIVGNASVFGEGVDWNDVEDVALAFDAILPAYGGPQPPAEAPADQRIIDLEATAALQFIQNGEQVRDIPVTPGETVVIRVDNTAGFSHSFYIGTDAELSSPNATTAVGIPAWETGVQLFEWQVPADITGLKFGCTVPGHYALMQGTISVSP